MNNIQVAAAVFLLMFSTTVEAVDLTQVPRTIGEQPEYTSPPKYCLLVFGPEAKTRVWLVHDKETLYADLNGDGDLTGSGERFTTDEKSSNVDDGTFAFNVGDVTDGDRLHKSLVMGTLNLQHLAISEPQIALALLLNPKTRFYTVGVDLELPGRQGIGVGGRVHHAVIAGDTNGALMFATTPEKAPIIHFSGEWQITLFGSSHTAQLTAGRTKDVFLGLGTPGLGPGTTAFAAYEGLVPKGLYPQLEITLPGDTGSVIEQTLLHRCCTYNFHGGVRLPEDVAAGKATVKVSFGDWIGGFVAPTTHQVNVAKPKFRITLGPVSPRLKASLIHPTRGGVLHGIHFSPDGKRIIAGEYPGGIVQLWDVETGEPLTQIDTGTNRHRTTEYFHLSPDWSSVYVALPKREYSRVERDGKRLMRWEFDGRIGQWDLASGATLRRLQHTPPRNVISMTLSPDGRYFLTGDEISGDYENHAPRRVSLWDTETGTARDISHSRSAYGVFSPDSRLVAITDYELTVNQHVVSSAINLFDTATGELMLTIPVEEESAKATVLGFTPDGATLIGRLHVSPAKGDRSDYSSSLKFWDVTSGRELASISSANGQSFMGSGTLSPDGRMLAITNWRDTHPELSLIDMARKEIVQTVRLFDEKANVWTPKFSPNGQWIAVATQVNPFPNNRFQKEPAAEDMPQPRIHLIETATGEIRETITASQGFATSLAFSPDGKTLASAGNGRVLLWDLSTPPGQ